MKFEDLAKAFSLEQKPRSTVEMAGEVPATIIGEYRAAALAQIAQEIEMPGFRKGKVPHDIALKKVGEMGVLEEAVELLVRDFYPELVELKGLDVVGRPDIRITKMAPGNPVSLTIAVATYPEVALPKNWKALAEKVPLEAAAEVKDEEVEKTLKELWASRKSSAPGDMNGSPAPSAEASASPEMTDEWARSLGAFENLEALRAQIKKGVGEEKARAARDARRGKIIDALIEQVKVEIPDVFVESELEKIMSQMREDVGRFGMTFDDYLKRLGKTESDIRGEFKNQAEKRAKLQLTLNKIAQEEKIEVEKELVEAEMKHALQHFPDANPELLGIHIQTVLRNEKTLRLLEGSTEPLSPSSHDHEH